MVRGGGDVGKWGRQEKRCETDSKKRKAGGNDRMTKPNKPQPAASFHVSTNLFWVLLHSADKHCGRHLQRQYYGRNCDEEQRNLLAFSSVSDSLRHNNCCCYPISLAKTLALHSCCEKWVFFSVLMDWGHFCLISTIQQKKSKKLIRVGFLWLLTSSQASFWGSFSSVC